MTSAFDPTTLNRLLQLAGPDFAGELLRRLHDDLTTVANRMTADRLAGGLLIQLPEVVSAVPLSPFK